MKPLIFGGIATASFIVASVASSLITTAVRPDTPGDLKPTPEAKIKETKTMTQKPKENSLSTTKTTTNTEKTFINTESPLTSTTPQPELPPSKGPGDIDNPRPLRSPTRGPGNLDELYSPQPQPKIGPGNL